MTSDMLYSLLTLCFSLSGMTSDMLYSVLCLQIQVSVLIMKIINNAIRYICCIKTGTITRIIYMNKQRMNKY